MDSTEVWEDGGPLTHLCPQDLCVSYLKQAVNGSRGHLRQQAHSLLKEQSVAKSLGLLQEKPTIRFITRHELSVQILENRRPRNDPCCFPQNRTGSASPRPREPHNRPSSGWERGSPSASPGSGALMTASWQEPGRGQHAGAVCVCVCVCVCVHACVCVRVCVCACVCVYMWNVASLSVKCGMHTAPSPTWKPGLSRPPPPLRTSVLMPAEPCPLHVTWAHRQRNHVTGWSTLPSVNQQEREGSCFLNILTKTSDNTATGPKSNKIWGPPQ